MPLDAACLGGKLGSGEAAGEGDDGALDPRYVD
jgi:hypothetical protein